MKDRVDPILRPAQARYLETLLPPRQAVLRAIEEEARRDSVPISDPEVGRLLGILARTTRPKRMLEIGTAIGYGALCLLGGSSTARLITIDHDSERLARAADFLGQAGVADRVELIEGEALDVLRNLEGRFGLVYIDAVKRNYRRYLDLVLPRLEVGGLILFDNLLWKGRVADPPPEPDAEADALRAFNSYVAIHPQLDTLVLPLGDGLGLATKTGTTVMEMGGPF